MSIPRSAARLEAWRALRVQARLRSLAGSLACDRLGSVACVRLVSFRRTEKKPWECFSYHTTYLVVQNAHVNIWSRPKKPRTRHI